MGSENKSPSYLEEREEARRWLLDTKEGQYAADILKEKGPHGIAAKVLDDDHFTDWESIVKEHRHDLVIAANCYEARNAVSMARQSSSLLVAPTQSHMKWRKIMSPPIWYVLRRQIETMDPNYWNDPANMYREALNNPQWTVVPADIIRGELEKHLPSGAIKSIGADQA